MYTFILHKSINMKRQIAFAFTFFIMITTTNAQQKVIPLYNGPAPGSESWNWDEAENKNNVWQTDIVYNVSKPSLTVFAPDAMASTGSAVIICPGGGFFALSINSEGNDVAKWLVKKGVTCFVLRYRLVHATTKDPITELGGKWGTKEFEEQVRVVQQMATADGRAAISYVREHAAEYGIDPKKIGIIGFSAGGYVAASTAFNYTPANRPDFIAPVYPFYPPEIVGNIPADAPPIFLVAASDDGLQLAPHSANLYNAWLAAKHPAEIHMYSTGNHGFGMRVQHLPSDTWIDRFGDWLRVNGYLKLKNPPEWMKNLKDWELDEMRRKDEERFHSDWQNLARYRDANAKLPASTSAKPRVVFMGNSITDSWINYDSAFFADNNYIDRGISGQTTPQMLIRFRPDVIDLKPAAVVILAGINDIAGNTGPMTLQETFGNIVSMVELAKASNIRPVIASVLPAYDFPWRPGMQPAEKVVQLNAMLKEYATKNKVVYLDYFTAMKDARNGLKAELTYDGVHPNLAGYKVMAPLAQQAIAAALKQK